MKEPTRTIIGTLGLVGAAGLYVACYLAGSAFTVWLGQHVLAWVGLA